MCSGSRYPKSRRTGTQGYGTQECWPFLHCRTPTFTHSPQPLGWLLRKPPVSLLQVRKLSQEGPKRRNPGRQRKPPDQPPPRTLNCLGWASRDSTLSKYGSSPLAPSSLLQLGLSPTHSAPPPTSCPPPAPDSRPQYPRHALRSSPAAGQFTEHTKELTQLKGSKSR